MMSLTDNHANGVCICGASDVDFVSDVHCVNDVVPMAQLASITPLRA